MKYPSYPEYKKAKDNWVGEAPKHWKELRTDFKAESYKKQISEKLLSGKDIFHYSIPNVQTYGSGAIEAGDDVDSAKLLITKKQLLVSKLNPRKATVCIAEPDPKLLTVASGEFVPILSEELNVRYALYVWLSDKVVKMLSSRVQSVTRSHQRVNPEDITKMNWAWPPSDEQEKIAEFLDYKTQQIDQLIDKKKALIEKLNEQRIAVITQAVTKGLDKNAKMKPSGVDWLGDVPEHWEVLKGKFIGKIASTPSLSEDEITDSEFELSYIKVEDLNKSENAYFFTKSDYYSLDDTKASTKNSIVFPKRGAAIFTNKATILEKPALIDPNLMSWELYNPEHLKFFYFALLARRLDDLADTSTVPQINNKHIMPAHFPSPPDEEKYQIVVFIEKKLEKISCSIRVNNTAIERLEEYRTALITDAVTGKIDVRYIQLSAAGKAA